jgi:hypothetical protein
MSEAERAERGMVGEDPENPDLCMIDGHEHYIRGVLKIPVVECAEAYVWGVWVSISEASLKRILELWEATSIDPDEPPRFGWLANQLPGYPQSHEVKCHVHIQPVGQRPLITLEPTDYPLAIEQRNGITLDRVKAIAARSHT